MFAFSRRQALKIAAASPFWFQDNSLIDQPQYQTSGGSIEFHCTDDYPARWKKIYQNTIAHFSKRWGRVGPTHIFLIENQDWPSREKREGDPQRLKESQQNLKQVFCKLQGHGLQGKDLDWTTGKHWMSWSNRPANLMITMTMSPYQDPMQFVLGPIHEYNHAIQTANGYGQEAIDGNQMGHALWTGPAWWREGSSVMVAALYSYQHPELFEPVGQAFTWGRFSGELNRNLELFQKAKTPLRDGVTHDDWQRLEQEDLVHPVVYAGGSVACAMLLKQAGSLEAFMNIYTQIPKVGWEAAFEQTFQVKLNSFYRAFEATAAAIRPTRRSEPLEDNEFAFLKTLS